MSAKKLWVEKLQTNGMRMTTQREAIVDVLLGSEKALEPLQVFELTHNTHPSIGMVTVYRTMECLAELGLLQKVHQQSGCNKFLKVKEGHNHLLICNRCGKAIYFEGLNLETQFEEIARKNNFTMQDHWLQLGGICQQCQLVVSA